MLEDRTLNQKNAGLEAFAKAPNGSVRKSVADRAKSAQQVLTDFDKMPPPNGAYSPKNLRGE